MLKLIRSMKFAFYGIWKAAKQEINFRIHIVAICFLVLFASSYTLTNMEIAILVLTVSAVLTAEIFNTAIENTINLVTDRHHEIAKVVKDLSAGAVLITAIVSLVIFYLIFSTKPVLIADIISLKNIIIFIAVASILFMPTEPKFKR